jgi:hypothetical protein
MGLTSLETTVAQLRFESHKLEHGPAHLLAEHPPSMGLGVVDIVPVASEGGRSRDGNLYQVVSISAGSCVRGGQFKPPVSEPGPVL